MLANDELKKKIVDVLIKVDEYVRNEIIKATEEHKAFLTGDNQYYYIVADALIAAGIGDVKEAELDRKAYGVASNQYRMRMGKTMTKIYVKASEEDIEKASLRDKMGALKILSEVFAQTRGAEDRDEKAALDKIVEGLKELK